MNRLFFLFLSLFISSQLFAQFPDVDTSEFYYDDTTETEVRRVRKYPARLWEISGNGLKQPSYLYGTMHVSKKLAFNLGDTFYKALQSVDVVALELAIDSWLSHIGRNRDEYMFGFNKYGSYNSEYGQFYKNALDFSGVKLHSLLRELGSEDYMSNFLLYRQGYQSPDYSEKTYVDLYIHQVGKKLNKYCTGLEDFDVSNRMVSRSSWRDRTFPGNSGGRYYPGYYDFGEDPTEKAYREGDLDMIDSLEKRDNPDKHFLKWMLYERNKVMADRIEEIVKTKRLFAAVGCAHLPGDSGVIEFLRRKGFVLTPVYDEIGDYAFKSKQKLETTNTPVTFKKYISHNGQLSFELPGVPLDRSTGNTEDIFYADVANGTYYVIKRFATYSAVNGINQQKLLKQIDSALYENIPGDITARSKTTVNGYPAIDVTNRTKSGESQRHMYIIMPNDVWYIKLNGAGLYAEGKEARDFFKSIAVQDLPTEWNTYSPEAGAYEVKWPAKVIQNRLSFDTSTNFRGHSTLEHTDKSGNLYFLRSVSLPYYAYDEDTFNMRQIAVNYAFYNNGKVENVEYTEIDGHTAMKFSIKLKERDLFLHLLLAADGDQYYSLGCFNRNRKAPSGFLESFQFVPFRYKHKLEKKYDSMAKMAYFRPDWKPIEDQHRKTVEETRIARAEITYPERSYGYTSVSEYFPDSLSLQSYYAMPVVFPTGEYISLYKSVAGPLQLESNLERLTKKGILKNNEIDFKRYRHYTDSVENASDSASLADIEATYKGLMKSEYIRDTLYTKNGFVISEMITHMPGTSWNNITLNAISDRVSYSAHTSFDIQRGLSEMAKQVLYNIDFENTAMTAMDSNAIAELMIRLLSSSDSIDLFRADDHSYELHKIPASYNDTLMKLMQMFDRNKKYGKSYAAAIERKLLADQYLPLISFYMDKFRRSGDTSEIQAEMLSNLGSMRNSEALDSMLFWLIEETPLAPESSYNSYVYSGIINTAYDSLKLWKNNYARLLPLRRYEEYEDPIMSLGITLLDSQFIDSTIFTPIVPELALSFRDDLKRKKAVPANRYGGGYGSSYGRNTGSRYKDPENYEYGSYGNTLFSSGDRGYEMDWAAGEEAYYDDYKLGSLTTISGMQKANYAVETPYYSYSGRSSNTLYDKARILVKFYHNSEEVKKRLSRIYTLQDDAEKMQFINLYMKHRISIPDTMYSHYIKQDEQRYGFTRLLLDRGLKDSIPSGLNGEKEMALSFLTYRQISKKDTMVFLGKRPTEIENEKGNLWFIKHANKDELKEQGKNHIWDYSYVWFGENDTLESMNAPRYYGLSNQMIKKQSVKDMMEMEASKLLYWRHPLWQALEPEDPEKDDYPDYGWGDY